MSKQLYPVRLGDTLYFSSNSGTMTYSCVNERGLPCNPTIIKEKPMKLPSLKTAASNYKKAKKARTKAQDDLVKARAAHDAASNFDNTTEYGLQEARQVLLQVAGK